MKSFLQAQFKRFFNCCAAALTPKYGKSIFIFLFSLVTLSSYSQTFQYNIGGTGDDEGYSIAKTNDGGYVIGGYTNSFGQGGYDVYVVKLDVNGAIQWTRTIGGTGDDKGYSIIQTSDSGYAVAGSTNSFGAGGLDVYVVKLDVNGNVSWTKTIGGSSDEEGYSIIQTKDGGYTISGITQTFAPGWADMYVVKLGRTGTLQWARNIGDPQKDDVAKGIIQSSDGGYALTGWSWRSVEGTIDIYLMKLDSTGTIQWITSFGGPSTEDGRQVIQTRDGGYAVAGDTWLGSGGTDIFIAKFTNSGSMLWMKTVGGASNDDPGGASTFVQTNDGGFALTGGASSFGAGGTDLYAFKLDSTGALQWTRTIGGTSDDFGYSIVQANDGGYVAVGTTQSFGTGGDIYVVKLDSAGNTCGNAGTGGSILSVGNAGMISTSNGSGGVSSSPAIVIDSGGVSTKICGINPLSIRVSSQTNVLCNGNCNGVATVTASGGTGPYTYTWLSGAGSNTNATGLCAGTYTITVTDAASNTASTSVTITQPAPLAITSSSTPASCGLGTGTITVTPFGGASAYTYTWSTNPVQTTQQITALNAGNYTVTVADANNCNKDTTITISAIGGTVPGILKAVRDTICQGKPGNMTLTGNSSSITQWQSSPDDINFSGISGAANTTTYRTPPLSQTTWYRVTVDSGACSAESDTLELFVPQPLAAYFSISQTSANQLNFNSDSSSGNIRSYHWDFGDGQTSSEVNPVHTFAKDTTYYVCLTLYDGSNCSYTFCRYSQVTDAVPSISAAAQWIVYPNPFGDRLFIGGEGLNKNMESIEIYNVLGQMVWNKNPVSSETTNPLIADVSGLSGGMYFLKIRISGVDYVSKVIKQ